MKLEAKKVSKIILMLLLINVLFLTFNVQPIKAQGGIIRADGAIDPPTAPIIRDGNVYTSGNSIRDNYYDVIIDGSSNFNTISGNNITNNESGIYYDPSDNNSVFGYNDALLAPDLPKTLSIATSAPVPPVAGYYETSEFLISSAAVGVIFLESNGAIDPSTENWATTEESNVISEITTGLNWLASQNPSADINFILDIQYGVPTSYEPINRPSYTEVSSGHELWISEAMTYLGYPGTYYFTQVRDYANDLRNTHDTDWAYVMFIVDSSNDPDGKFTDNKFAYAYYGGPFLVMTYDNNGWGISNMDKLAAHETGHIYYATDEYNSIPQYSGYLNVLDNDGTSCIMNYNTWLICTNTKEQLGWRDTDGDGIQDIVDTLPNTVLTPYFPDPPNETVLTYVGNATVTPYPNNNPRGWGRDITINTIAEVEFRVNNEIWQNAYPVDGVFDEAEEDFFFNTSILSEGTHTVEVRAINSVGNIEISIASDEVTILYDPVTHARFVVRELDNRIYYCIYDGSWGGWNVLPGTTCDSPAASMLGNELHIVVRSIHGILLWHGYLTDPSDPTSFSGWALLSGATPSAPTMVSDGTALYLVVRGWDNRIYYRIYEDSWGGWNVLPGTTCDSPAASMLGNELHIVVRSIHGILLWHGYLTDPSDPTSFSGWALLSGATPSAPTMVSDGTALYLVVRGWDNRIYYRIYEDSWGGWNVLPGTTCDSPAASMLGNELHIVVKSIDGIWLWHGYLTDPSDPNSFLGWTLLSGYSPSAL